MQDLQQVSCIFPSIYEKNQSFLTGYVVEHTGFEPVTSTMRIDLDALSGLTRPQSLEIFLH